MKNTTYRKIQDHGVKLVEFFGIEADYSKDTIPLCKKLRRLENRYHRLAEALCSDERMTQEIFDKQTDNIEKQVRKLLDGSFLKDHPDALHFNSDPRGYSLKIDDQYAKDFYRRDWGGYGLIAPDLTEN